MRNKTMTRSKNIKPVKAVTKKTPLSGKSLLSKKIEKKGKTKPGLKDTISLKKHATGTLNSKNAERYKKMIDSIEDGYFEVDIAGNFTFFNDSVCLNMGYSRKELMGMNTRQFTDKENAKKLFQAFNRVYKTGKPLKEIDWQIIRKDGNKRYIEASVSLLQDSSGKPTGFRGISRDVTERKLTEEKLCSEEQRFRALAEQSSDIIIFVNREGIITYENPAVERSLGLKAEERIGVSLFERIHPDDLKFASNVFKTFALNTSAKDINTPIRQIRLRHQDGSWRTFETSGSKLLHNNIVESVIINLRDITERKKAEKDLLESEELFRNLFQYHSAVKLIIDPDTGNIIDANQAAVKYYGWPHEKITRMNIQDINMLPPEEVKAAMEKVQTRKRVRFEFCHRRADSSIRDVEVFSSNIIAQGKNILHSIVHDITERKKAETSLRESEQLRWIFLNSTSDMVFLKDDNYCHLIANRSLYKFYGKTEKEIIGKTDFDLMTEKEAVQCRKTDEQALLSTAPLITEEVVMGRYYETMKFPVELPKGKKGIGAYIRDITKRKQTEEELKKYRNHLEELVRERTIKLEASNKELEAFSYSASHDLRAPLRSIDGFSQALLEDCEDKLDIQGNGYLIRIRAATRRMADLIEDLLQLSRLTRTEMNIEKINLTRIARSVIDELQKSQPQRHVEMKIADGLEDTADSRLMRITLENLLGNAWKFTEKQAKAVIEFGCTKEGKKKVYFIRDNGAGFDMAYADKLFAPFQRLHNEEEFPGTGIGLAIVRRIIHRHGGRIWTEGQLGKGATFYFIINEK
jgi:PAS domain S-box-containing protein